VRGAPNPQCDQIRLLAARPAIRKVTDVEEQDFDNGVIVGEHLSAGYVLPHLRVQAFDGIGGVDQAAELDRIFKKGGESVPMTAPGRGSSVKPSIPLTRKRSRHLPTVLPVTPSRRAIS
jgi:hypothetical protein